MNQEVLMNRTFIDELVKAITSHAEPRHYDWLIFWVAIGGILVSLCAIVFTYRIYKRQTVISDEQIKIAERQTKIAEQQNKIALFEKRYELYLKILLIFENMTAVIKILEIVDAFSTPIGEEINSNKIDDYNDSKRDREMYLVYMRILLFGDREVYKQDYLDDGIKKYFRTTKQKEIETFQKTTQMRAKFKEYQDCLDNIEYLFALPDVARDNIKKIKKQLILLEEWSQSFFFGKEEKERFEGGLKKLSAIVSESEILENLQQQLYL